MGKNVSYRKLLCKNIKKVFYKPFDNSIILKGVKDWLCSTDFFPFLLPREENHVISCGKKGGLAGKRFFNYSSAIRKSLESRIHQNFPLTVCPLFLLILHSNHMGGLFEGFIEEFAWNKSLSFEISFEAK